MNIPPIRPSRIANVIGSCEWSPTMRGSQSKPQPFELVPLSPYQARSRLTAYFGKLCHQPVGVFSLSRYSVSVR
jgi:hypothetical protein